MKYLSQSLKIEGGGEIRGPLDPNINNLGDLLNVANTFLIPLAGIILFIILIIAGYGFIFSRGDPEKLKSAKGKLTSAIIGFIILVSAYLIVRVIAQIFGIGEEIFK